MRSGGGFLKVVEGRPGGSGTITSRDFAPGEMIMEVAVDVELDHPSRFTLQLGVGRHVDAGEIRYLNHSCAPNAYFAASARRLVAEREIRAGDEVSIFYPASEWDMACPFLCECGADSCIEFVTGADHRDELYEPLRVGRPQGRSAEVHGAMVRPPSLSRELGHATADDAVAQALSEPGGHR